MVPCLPKNIRETTNDTDRDENGKAVRMEKRFADVTSNDPEERIIS